MTDMNLTIHSAFLPQNDPDAALAFYTGVLGFELVLDTEAMPGARMIEVRPPGSEVSVVLLPPDGFVQIEQFGGNLCCLQHSPA